MDSDAAAISSVRARRADLLLVDLRLPDSDGVKVVRRAAPQAVIAILTAPRTEIDVVGLETGADDYLTKPVRLAQLRPRIRAIRGRPGRAATTALARRDRTSARPADDCPSAGRGAAARRGCDLPACRRAGGVAMRRETFYGAGIGADLEA